MPKAGNNSLKAAAQKHEIFSCTLDIDIISWQKVIINATYRVLSLDSLAHYEDLILEADFDFYKVNYVYCQSSVSGVPAREDYETDRENKRLIIRRVATPLRLDLTVELNPHLNFTQEGIYVVEAKEKHLVANAYLLALTKIVPFVYNVNLQCRFSIDVTAPITDFPVILANGKYTQTIYAKYPRDKSRHTVRFEDNLKRTGCLFGFVAGKFIKISTKYISVLQSDSAIDLDFYLQPDNLTEISFAMKITTICIEFLESDYKLSYGRNNFSFVSLPYFNKQSFFSDFRVSQNKFLLTDVNKSSDKDVRSIFMDIANKLAYSWCCSNLKIRGLANNFIRQGLAKMLELQCAKKILDDTYLRIKAIKKLRYSVFLQDKTKMACPLLLEDENNFWCLEDGGCPYKTAEIFNSFASFVGYNYWQKVTNNIAVLHKDKDVDVMTFFNEAGRLLGRDFKQWINWFNNIGAVQVIISEEYNQETKEYILNMEQKIISKNIKAVLSKPVPIVCDLSLLAKDGKKIPIFLKNKTKTNYYNQKIVLTSWRETFVFSNVFVEPISVLFKNYSAPIEIINAPLLPAKLLVLIKHSDNDFDKYNVLRQLIGQVILINAKKLSQNVKLEESDFLDISIIFSYILKESNRDSFFKVIMLKAIINEEELIKQNSGIHFNYLVTSLLNLNIYIANLYKKEIVKIYDSEFSGNIDIPFPEGEKIRIVINSCLKFIVFSKDIKLLSKCLEQYNKGNTTLKLGAIDALNALPGYTEASKLRNELLERFYLENSSSDIHILNWFAVKVKTHSQEGSKFFVELQEHALFDFKDAAKVVALVDAFVHNPYVFHKNDGSGYKLLADLIIKLDNFNQKLMLRFLPMFLSWQNIGEAREKLIFAQLERLKVELEYPIAINFLERALDISTKDLDFSRKAATPDDLIEESQFSILDSKAKLDDFEVVPSGTTSMFS